MCEAADVDKIGKGYIDRNTIKMMMDNDSADAPALESRGPGVLNSTVLRTHYNVDDGGEVSLTDCKVSCDGDDDL